MVTAKFTNGFSISIDEDECAGCFAWMVVHPDGRIDADVTEDLDLANSTAVGAAAHRFDTQEITVNPLVLGTKHGVIYAHALAKNKGFANYEKMLADQVSRRNKYLISCTMEVVELHLEDKEKEMEMEILP
jgi:hypothetical protein